MKNQRLHKRKSIEGLLEGFRISLCAAAPSFLGLPC